MRTIKYYGHHAALMLVALATFFFTACGESNDTPEVTSARMKVNVKLAPGYGKATLGKVKVTLRNVNSGNEITINKQSADGTMFFTDLPVDMYDVTATYTMSGEDYKQALGLKEFANDEVLFSASATGLQLKPGEEKEVNLELTTSSTDDFVIKTIYYAGSDDNKAASENDQFIEIYNNSARVLYADSLCIAVTIMNRYGPGHKLNDARYYYTEDGRYDWSKAQGMKDVKGANDDYYYANMLFMIPGTGKTYPVRPGESFIIARSAQNYKAPFTTARGKTVKPELPESTVDLSSAEFEVIYKGQEDLDNQNVPNVMVVHPGNNRYMRLSRFGKEGFAIFRHPAPDKLPLYVSPAVDPAQGSNSQYMQFPNANVIDAVEVINPTADGYVSPKAFRKKHDAGYTYSDAPYSSLCVTRKVARVDGTRKVLQDINNSTLDFVTMKADPKGFAPTK